MIRKLFRTGRTLAVGVPEAAAAAAGLAEGDYVMVEVDDATGALLLWPAALRERVGTRGDYLRQVGEFLAAYGPALAALEAAAPSADADAATPPADR